MNAENFNQLLKNPSQLKLSELPLLTEVIEKYPYFQAPRAVRLKSLKEQENYLYNQKLKETAAYTVDRGVLFEFITSKVFTAAQTIIEAEETLEEIKIAEVVTEEQTTAKDVVPEIIAKVATENISAEAITMTNEEANQIVDPFLFEEKNNEKPIPETISVNAPLTFEKGETHSFSEWLKLASLEPIVRKKEKPKPLKKKLIESSLIDNFLKNNPKISPVKKGAPSVNFAAQNNIPTEDLMTETLAKVYLAQHNYKKAIQAYKILSLKNPEKSGLFADQIRAIEKLQNNK